MLILHSITLLLGLILIIVLIITSKTRQWHYTKAQFVLFILNVHLLVIMLYVYMTVSHLYNINGMWNKLNGTLLPTVNNTRHILSPRNVINSRSSNKIHSFNNTAHYISHLQTFCIQYLLLQNAVETKKVVSLNSSKLYFFNMSHPPCE